MQLSNAVAARPAYALRRTMPAVWASVHAMQLDVSARDFHRVAEFGCISDYAPRTGRVVCQVNGVYVSRRDWWRPVQAGDVVVFVQVAGEEGSNPLRVLLQIVVLVASIYTGGLAGAAISIAGTLLINALLPLLPPPLADGQTPSPTYSVAFQGNQARLGQSIPERFGQERVFPDFAAQPYNFFEDDDQYYCAVLCLGFGEFNVLQVALDDTDIRNFQDVEFGIVGPGQTSRASDFSTFESLEDQDIAADNIVTSPEVSGQQLVDTQWVGAFAPVRGGLALDAIFIDLVFPGLGVVDDDGSIDNRSISWQVGVRLVDDSGNPLEAWRTLATETITRNTSEAIRLTYAYTSDETVLPFPGWFQGSVTVPAAISIGRYEVRLRRVTARTDNRRVLNDMIWAGLRARLSVRGINREDCTFVVIKARASEQLSGLSQRRFTVVAQRLIERYDSNTETWSASPLTVAANFTRNPAEIARYIMHRRGLADSRIDHATLDELRDLYDERQDRFDFSFDSRVSFNDALQLVGRAGRARALLRRGAVYTLVRDELQTLPVAMFVPRNMDADSFAIDVALSTDETPDAVLFRYRDGQVSAERVVYGQVHEGAVYAYPADESGTPQRPAGVPEPARVQEERLDGIAGQSHALREAAYFMAAAFYRRMYPSWTTNLEALLPAYGSLVGLAHDVAPWGQSGDVVDWDEITRTLTTSEPLAWTAGGTHYVRLQSSTAGVGEAILVTPGAADNEMVLDQAPAEAPVFDRADRERTRYLFGELAEVSRYARMLAIRPQSQTSIRLEAVIDDARVHAADNAWLPVGGEVQDALPDPNYTPDGSGAAQFVEDFEAGLGDYTVVLDTADTFELAATEYGQSLQVNSVNVGDIQRIERDIDPVTFTEASWRFRITEAQSNDPGILELANNGGWVLRFNAYRDASFDGLRRARWDVLGQTQRITPGALEVGTWYRAQVLVVPGSNNTTISIYRESDDALIAQAGLSVSVSSITADQLAFYADQSGQTTAIQFDDITLT